MKKLLYITAFGLFCSFVSTLQYSTLKSITGKNIIFTTDKMGNAFLAGANGDLTKYNRNGDSLTAQNYKQFGDLESIDATNPFEIYLYYKDLNKVLFLDNQLTKRGEFDLEDVELENISAVARSADNGIWAYDLSTNRLKKYAKSSELLLESVRVNFYSNKVISPFQILDKQNQVYLCDSVEGIFVFDNFGTFYKRLDIKTNKPIQVQGDNLLYAKDSSYYKYSLKFFKEEKLPYIEDCNYLRWEKNRLFVLKEEEFLFLASKEGNE